MGKEGVYKIVYNVIEQYDPIGIAWCAEDEYKAEAIEIANRCIVLSKEELFEYIKEVFEFWFGGNLASDKDDIYKNIADEIKSKLDNWKKN